jgi:hypothetical protein
MISSNSGTDFIALAKANGHDPMDIINQPEFKDWMMEHLASTDLTVEFTKKDGEKRRMHCTRNLDKIPSLHQPSNSKTSSTTDAIPVFDLEKSEWRSFNLSNLTRIEWSLT